MILKDEGKKTADGLYSYTVDIKEWDRIIHALGSPLKKRGTAGEGYKKPCIIKLEDSDEWIKFE